MQSSRRHFQDLAFVCALAITAFFYWQRVHYGIAQNDESFLVAIALRFIRGDIPVAQEWNLAQFSALLLVPLVSLHQAIFHTTESIYLHFRILFAAFQLLIMIFGYLMLRKKGWLSIFFCLIYGLFVYMGIISLTYNTMPLMFLFLISVLILSGCLKHPWANIWIGILLALAALCNPFLILLYLFFLAAIIWNRKHTFFDTGMLCWKNFFLSLSASLVIFLATALLILTRVSFAEIYRIIPLLLSDQTHQAKTISDIILSPFTNYMSLLWKERAAFVICMILPSLFPHSHLFSERNCFLLLCLASVYGLLDMSLFHITGYGADVLGAVAIMLLLPHLSIYCLVYGRQCRAEIEPSVLLVWCLGFAYAFCNHLSSNQGLFTISNAMTIACASSVWIISPYIRDRFPSAKASWLLTFLLCVQLFSESHILLNHVFHEQNSSSLNTLVTDGPSKGLITSESAAASYASLLDDLQKTCIDQGYANQYILLLDNHPDGYVFLDAPVGAYSVWNESTDYLYDKRINTYYSLYPQKTPAYIYIDQSSAELHEESYYVAYTAENGYSLSRTEHDGLLMIKKK